MYKQKRETSWAVLNIFCKRRIVSVISAKKGGTMEFDVNLLGVLVATAASMAVGMIWYNERVFGKSWIKMAKIDPKKGSMAWSMGTVVVSSFVMAFVLAHFTSFAHHVTLHDGLSNSFLMDSILTALWAWLGFQGLRFFMHDQFNQRRKKESLIHMGNDLVTLLVMGVMIGLVGQ